MQGPSSEGHVFKITGRIPNGTFKGRSREEDLEHYKRIRNELNHSIRRAKRMAEVNLARNNNKDLKKFFSFYKFKSKDKKIGPIKIGGNLVSSDKELVNIFNAYFASVFTEERLDSSLETNSSNIHARNRCAAFEIELNEIKSLLEHIDPNKAAGPDGVYGRILKEGSSSIAKALTVFDF